MRALCFVVLLLPGMLLAGVRDVYPFQTEQQERQYQKILQNVRCMVCQNQSLADSNATLAVAMRERIYQMLIKGRSEQDINQYLRERYGDFIFYTPPWQTRTFFLWISPIVLLILGLASVLYYIRRMPSASRRIF